MPSPTILFVDAAWSCCVGRRTAIRRCFFFEGFARPSFSHQLQARLCAESTRLPNIARRTGGLDPKFATMPSLHDRHVYIDTGYDRQEHVSAPTHPLVRA